MKIETNPYPLYPQRSSGDSGQIVRRLLNYRVSTLVMAGI